MCRAGTESSPAVHVRRFEGSVHMRSVPVKADINPDRRTRGPVIRLLGIDPITSDSPAPTDRRRLPVNRDIVCREGLRRGRFTWDDGRKRLFIQGSLS